MAKKMRLFAKMDVEAILTDERFISAGPIGFTIFWRGVSYSKQRLQDGFVSRDSLAFITPGISDKDAKKAVAALLACGLWRQVEGGYATPEDWWEENQTTAEQVEAKRDADAERKRRERERREAEKASRHTVVTRDTERNPSGITALSQEGTEHRAQSTEHILPNGSNSAAAIPLGAGWEPLGDWLDSPELRGELAKIEGRRSPEITEASRPKVERTRDVLIANGFGLDALVRTLRHPDAGRWRGLDPEGVLKLCRKVHAQAGNPGGNPEGEKVLIGSIPEGARGWTQDDVDREAARRQELLRR